MWPARRWIGLPAAAVAVAVAATLLAAGCGGGDDDSAGGAESASSTGAGSKLALSADPKGKLAFDTNALQGKAGRITIVMKNPAPLSHNVSLEGPGIDEEGETVGRGGTSTVSADLKPGDYTFYCSV